MAKKKKLKDRTWRKRFQLEYGGDPPLGTENDADDLVGRVEQRGSSLDIFIDGYGTKTMQPDFGPVVTFDFWEGKLQVLVYSDINEEDPVHKINLEGALEAHRGPTEDEIEEAWQEMIRKHIAPSRLFAIGTGLIEQTPADTNHFSSCKQCERFLRAYQETMKE